MSREEKISLTTAILVLGFFGAVVFHYINEMWLHLPFPMNTFLPGPVTDPSHLFGDWAGIVFNWQKDHFFGTAIYFPGMYLLVQIFSGFQSYFWSVISYVVIFTGLIFLWIYQQLKVPSWSESIKNAVIGCFMCYPFLFIFQTGNTESFIFISLALFFHFYRRQNPYLAGLCLAFPISAKLVAAVLLFVPIFEKRYRDAVWTVIWTTLLTLSSLLIFDGGIRSGGWAYFERLQNSQKIYSSIMVTGDGGNHYGHSLLTLIRLLFPNSLPMIGELLHFWSFLAVGLFSIVLLVVWYSPALWQRVTLLICCMNLLPFASTDYKLMHLWLPLGLFINTNTNSRADWLFVTVFSILLMPKNFAYLRDNPIDSISCVISPLLMILLIVMIAVSVFMDRRSSRPLH